MKKRNHVIGYDKSNKYIEEAYSYLNNKIYPILSFFELTNSKEKR